MLRWSLTIALALLLVVHALCVPLYAGASISPSLRWRLEHARLTITRSNPGSPESFFIDFNSEGLKFAIDYRFSARNNWYLTLPLWVPIAVLAIPTGFAWTAHTRRRKRRRSGACLSCGYARAGLAPHAPCPECGRPARVPETPSSR